MALIIVLYSTLSLVEVIRRLSMVQSSSKTVWQLHHPTEQSKFGTPLLRKVFSLSSMLPITFYTFI